MNKNKYLVYKNRDGWSVPILFPMVIEHSEMASFITSKSSDNKIVSAGFWKISPNNEYIPYGESFSLKMGINEIDVILLNQHFNNGNIPPTTNKGSCDDG